MSPQPKEEIPVCVARARDGQPAREMLAECLEKAGLWALLAAGAKEREKEPADLRIAILPDMEFYRNGACTGTDPWLVEMLLDELFGRGYERAGLVAGADPSAVFLENRDGWVLADLAGYRFETPGSVPYDLHDLTVETAPAAFHPQSVLHGKQLGAAWMEADVRLVFAKNKSHESRSFALGTELLASILPGDTVVAAQREDALTDLLRQYPPHFAIIDGWVSCHGSLGSLKSRPLDTRVFIASPNLLLADWTAALLMNLDPYLNPLNAHALREVGLPSRYRFEGDLSPVSGWQAPSLWQREAASRRNEDPIAEQLARAWLLDVDTEIFPFRHVLDARMNESLKPWLGHADESPFAGYGLTALNFGLGWIRKALDNSRILYQKDKLRRRPSSLGFDPHAYGEADYDQVEHYIRPLEQVAAQTPPDENGLRWRYLDGSILFQYARVLEVPYEVFIEKADIARAVTYMYDNMGGKRVTVSEDAAGRVVRQAERDIYLPQPNWLALFGGEWIDVCKIETIQYRSGAESIYWRTVASPNKSARFDDGKISFERHPGGTKVSIVARQEFSLPLFWQVFNLDYLPHWKEAIVSHAYVSFFNRTMANLEAVSEGRDPRQGRMPAPFGHDPDRHPLAIEHLEELFQGIDLLLPALRGGKAGPRELGTDARGYKHFASGDGPDTEHPLRQIARELGAALAKDLRFRPPQNPES